MVDDVKLHVVLCYAVSCNIQEGENTALAIDPVAVLRAYHDEGHLHAPTFENCNAGLAISRCRRRLVVTSRIKTDSGKNHPMWGFKDMALSAPLPPRGVVAFCLKLSNLSCNWNFSTRLLHGKRSDSSPCQNLAQEGHQLVNVCPPACGDLMIYFNLNMDNGEVYASHHAGTPDALSPTAQLLPDVRISEGARLAFCIVSKAWVLNREFMQVLEIVPSSYENGIHILQVDCA